MRVKLGTVDECVDLYAGITSCAASDLSRSFRRDSALRCTGLVSFNTEPHDMEDYLELSDGLASLMLETHESVTVLIQHFFTPRGPGPLDASHFPHLAEEIHVIAGILREAMRQGIVGTNVLLYGPPGVGKTELAAVVAHMLGAEIYEVGYANKEGDPIRGVARLRAYTLCQRLLSQRNDAVVLFDEVEDMLEDGETPGKAWVNRTLEENAVPAIWITNSVRALDPAYRRRFDYSVHMKTPPRAVRRQIAQHHLRHLAPSGADDSATDDWLDALADQASLTPGQMERAAKVARLVAPDVLAKGDVAMAQACVNRVLERSSRLLGQAKPRSARQMGTAYDLAYLHTDVPVANVVDALQLAPGGSFCLYGPPGSGKTALARHIAHMLDLPVMLRRASDLLSMYVGGTEHALAEMFDEARAEPCVLILDEADSFLQARAEARHSWEITQVNELLTQMEEFDGLFICTTNLLEKLDPASLRRFDWKIAFRAMTAGQRWAFFLQEFHLLGGNIDTAQSLQALVRQQLNGLTPGDFAPVTRQFRLLRRTPTAQEFFERLRAELHTHRPGHAGHTDSPEVNRSFANHASNFNLPVAA